MIKPQYALVIAVGIAVGALIWLLRGSPNSGPSAPDANSTPPASGPASGGDVFAPAREPDRGRVPAESGADSVPASSPGDAVATTTPSFRLKFYAWGAERIDGKMPVSISVWERRASGLPPSPVVNGEWDGHPVKLDLTMFGEHLRAGGVLGLRAEDQVGKSVDESLSLDAFKPVPADSGWLEAYLEVTFHPEPILTGRVLDERGMPCPGAFIGVLDPAQIVRDGPKMVAYGSTEPDGRFLLHSLVPGQRIFMAHVRGLRVHQEDIVIPPKGKHDLGDLRLETGVCISGTATWILPGPYRIYIQLKQFDGIVEGHNGPGLRWKDGQLLEASVNVISDPNGNYEFSGLEEETYTVQFMAAPEASSAAGIGDQSGGPLTVRAPAEGVNLTVTIPAFLIKVRSPEGVPIPWAKVDAKWNGEIGFRGSSRADGDLLVTVPTDQQYEVRVSMDGYDTVEMRLTSPSTLQVKEVLVELTPTD